MKKIFLLLFAVSMIFTACGGVNTPKTDTISTIVVEDKVSDIAFDFSNIQTIVYLDDDDVCIVRYDDPDVFDYQTLALITKRDEWYGEYIDMDIEESILPMFVYDYNDWKETDNYWKREQLSNKYKIVEHIIKYADGVVDIIYDVEIRYND